MTENAPIEEQQAFLDAFMNNGVEYWTVPEHRQMESDLVDTYLNFDAEDQERKNMDTYLDEGNIGDRVRDALLTELADSIPVNKVQNAPKPQLRPNLRHLAEVITAAQKISVATQGTAKAMQELSDKLDRDKREQKHQWSSVEFTFASYMACSCGFEAHSEAEFEKHNAEVKRIKAGKPRPPRPEHLTDRPFVANEALRSLQKQLHAEARSNGQSTSRKNNRKSNPKAKRQR